MLVLRFGWGTPGFKAEGNVLLRTLVHLLIFLLILAVNGMAQLSPGPLHKTHQKLEGLENCTQCHERGNQLSTERCLNCHQLLKERIEQGKGLHARPEFNKCQTCHVEHHGRDFDLIFWKNGQEAFDHQKTGYPLKGAHAKLKCQDCHNRQNITNPEQLLKQGKNLDKTFLGLNTKCLSCHLDEHRGQLETQCTKCHNFQAWKPAPGFNHDQTAFPLTGKHQKVKCEQCHAIQTDVPIGNDATYLRFKVERFKVCTDCHSDFHKGKLGTNCQSCHTTAGWKQYNKQAFNHDLTAFPLKGQHRFVPCEQCHRPGVNRKILKFQNCVDCHSDYHQGQLSSNQCDWCHTVQGWLPTTFSLEAHQKTDYPLRGAHLAVPCNLCHQKETINGTIKTTRFKFTSVRCAACHSDPHDGQVEKYKKLISRLTNKDGCEHCHNVKSWNQVAFDHALTPFNLDGQHQNVRCLQCHKPNQQNVIQFVGLANQCASCHQDIHRGQFKQQDGRTDCAQCHTTLSWKAEKFDHNRNARFKLTGAHQKVACSGCHFVEQQGTESFVRYKPIAFSCKACHGTQYQKPRGQ